MPGATNDPVEPATEGIDTTRHVSLSRAVLGEIRMAAAALLCVGVLGSCCREAIDMTGVNGGAFLMGLSSGPREEHRGKAYGEIIADPVYDLHRVKVDSFLMSIYPTTNGQFAAFLRASGYSVFPWEVVDTLRQDQDYPVVCDYYDAIAYCWWLSSKNGQKYRLPTEAEWEYAATGGQEQNFPWGMRADSTVTKARRNVGAEKKDRSPFGVYDLFANEDEMMMDFYDPLFYRRSPEVNPFSFDSKEPNINTDRTYEYMFGPNSRTIEAGGPNGGVRAARAPALGELAFHVVQESTHTLFNKGTQYEAAAAVAPCILQGETELYEDAALKTATMKAPVNAEGWVLATSNASPGSVFIVLRSWNGLGDGGRGNVLNWRDYWGWCSSNKIVVSNKYPKWSP